MYGTPLLFTLPNQPISIAPLILFVLFFLILNHLDLKAVFAVLSTVVDPMNYLQEEVVKSTRTKTSHK
jgi:hypothetical protein